MNASGRTAHKMKITVYLTEAELNALEGSVFEMRRRGLRIDRSRYVREALVTSSFNKIADRVRAGA